MFVVCIRINRNNFFSVQLVGLYLKGDKLEEAEHVSTSTPYSEYAVI